MNGSTTLSAAAVAAAASKALPPAASSLAPAAPPADARRRPCRAARRLVGRFPSMALVQPVRVDSPTACPARPEAASSAAAGKTDRQPRRRQRCVRHGLGDREAGHRRPHRRQDQRMQRRRPPGQGHRPHPFPSRQRQRQPGQFAAGARQERARRIVGRRHRARQHRHLMAPAGAIHISAHRRP